MASTSRRKRSTREDIAPPIEKKPKIELASGGGRGESEGELEDSQSLSLPRVESQVLRDGAEEQERGVYPYRY